MTPSPGGWNVWKAVPGSVLLGAWLLSACAAAELRQVTSLDADWRFHRGDLTSAASATSPPSPDSPAHPVYEDSSWQRVDVPHAVRTTLANESGAPTPAILVSEVLDAGGRVIATARREQPLPNCGTATVHLHAR